jgi:hypothetical protein
MEGTVSVNVPAQCMWRMFLMGWNTKCWSSQEVSAGKYIPDTCDGVSCTHDEVTTTCLARIGRITSKAGAA